MFSFLVKSKVALVGFCLVGFWITIALFANDCIITPACWANKSLQEPIPWLARYSPNQQFRGEAMQPSSAKHWLGTDRNARDIWARLAVGSRPILLLAPISVILAMLIGGTMGVTAGYFGGILDEVLMRFLDAVLAFPSILLYMVIIAALGPSPLNILIAITVSGSPGIARLVRGLTLDLKTRDYVAAAKTRGESSLYIMFIEILPNARGPIIVDGMLRIGYAVFSIGTLGFLGLGLPPPSPDWGSIVNTGRQLIQLGRPESAIFGSAAIAMLVVGFNLISDGLTEESNRYN